MVLITACLNGAHRPDAHPHLPATPPQLADEAVAAVRAGAGALHIHPKAPDGADSLHAVHVDATLGAVRAAVPGVPVGVTTGAWAEPDATARVHRVRGWRRLPDFASVNWREPGSEAVARALLRRGVDVEAGLSTVESVEAFDRSGLANRCLRILLEVEQQDPAEALAAATALHRRAAPLHRPVVLHGEGTAAWAVFDQAVAAGTDLRIGLEDVLTLPDGSPCAGNAELVAEAVARLRRAASVPPAYPATPAPSP